MIDFIRRPFGHEPVLKKEEIGRKKKKEDQRANDITGTLKRMWQFISEERALLYGIIFLVTLTSLLSITGPFLVGYIVDNYFIPGEMDGLSTILLFLLVVYILLSSTQYTAAFFMVGLSQRTVYKLRSRLFSHMQKLPVSFYDKRQHGELMSRMTNDIETISQTLNTSFIQFTTSIVTLIGTISVMLYLSPLLTLLTVLIIPVLIFAVGFITRRTGPLYKKRQRATGS